MAHPHPASRKHSATSYSYRKPREASGPHCQQLRSTGRAHAPACDPGRWLRMALRRNGRDRPAGRRASRRFPVLRRRAAVPRGPGVVPRGSHAPPPSLRGPTGRCCWAGTTHYSHWPRGQSATRHSTQCAVRMAHDGGSGRSGQGPRKFGHAPVHCGAGARRGALLSPRR